MCCGVLLRGLLAWAIPPERSYDDHFEPVQILLQQQRLPDAADCWECYQPPLYYVVSAGVFRAGEALAGLNGAGADAAQRAGRKAMQFVSVAAGGLTLVLCVLVLRVGGARPAWIEALALGLAAFLPAHVLMSAIVTNDALTYLLATAAIYAALRAFETPGATRWWVLAGAAAGAAILCKSYALMTAAAIAATVLACGWMRGEAADGAQRRSARRGLLLLAAATIGVGIWPAARTTWTFGRPHVDNFDFFDSPMRFQPPGRVGAAEFLTLRGGALLARPYVHATQVNSVPTQLYARFWFDYEGFPFSLAASREWARHWEACAQRYPEWSPARWTALLSYDGADVPPRFVTIARASYIAGLPLTIAVLGGVGLALARARSDRTALLHALNLLLALLVPLVQFLRLPHFAALKAGFALCGLASAAALLVLVISTVRGGARIVLATILAFSVAMIAAADGAYLAALWRAGLRPG